MEPIVATGVEVLTSENENSVQKLTHSLAADEVSQSIMMQNLTNLYTNRELAVLREGVQNAIDAGGSRMPEVTLPSTMNPVLVIQDFGTGMSNEFATTKYLQYGASGKRGVRTEDGKRPHGGFGYGSKTPALISDQYIVRTAYRNEQGELEKTLLRFIQTPLGVAEIEAQTYEDDSDQTGTTIIAPLKYAVTDSVETNWRILATDLFSTFSSPVKVNGEVATSAYDNMIKVNDKVYFGTEPVTDYQDANSASGTSGVYAVVGGNIHYPVNFLGRIGSRYSDSLWEGMCHQATYGTGKILVNVDVDDVDVPPARDTVMDTEKSRKSIITALQTAADEYLAEIQKAMDSAETTAEAVRAWKSVDAIVPGSRLRNYLPLTFQGAELEEWFNLAPDNRRTRAMVRGSSTEFRVSSENYPISASTTSTIFTASEKFLAVTGYDPKNDDHVKAVSRLARPFFLEEGKKAKPISDLLFFSEEVFTQSWLHLDPNDPESTVKTITMEDFLTEGEARREAQKAAAGPKAAPRRRLGYTVHTMASATDEDFPRVLDTEELSMTDIRDLQDEDAPVAFTTGGAGFSASEEAFAGYRIVALRDTQAPEALLKRVPKAVPVQRVRTEFAAAEAANLPQEEVDRAAYQQVLQARLSAVQWTEAGSFARFLLEEDDAVRRIVTEFDSKFMTHVQWVMDILKESDADVPTAVNEALRTLQASSEGLARLGDATDAYKAANPEPEVAGFKWKRHAPLLVRGYSSSPDFHSAERSHVVAYLRMVFSTEFPN